MLLSDRDIRAQVDAGRVGLEPFDAQMIQPASVDVRLDRYFRLFDNHKYAMIDPATEQADLTREVQVDPEEPYMLHPGEFVLASTYEQITLPDDVAAMALPVLAHRLVPSVEAAMSGRGVETILQGLVAAVPVPSP